MSDKVKINKNSQNEYDLSNSNLSTLDISNNNSVELEFPSDSVNHPENFSKKIGKCFVYFYTDGTPLIVIGPDCKFKQK